jgi:lysophospholipase L1-like esterase
MRMIWRQMDVGRIEGQREMKKVCGIILAVSAFLQSTAVFAHSAVEPVSRLDDTDWKTRFERLNQDAQRAGKSASIVFIGDSITQGWETEGKDIWADYYARRHALNLGINGDRTQDVLWRLDHGNIASLAPKLIVLMIGTNNIRKSSVVETADGVHSILNKLRSALPDAKILLVGVFPRSENPGDMRGYVLQLNQIIKKFADGNKVQWIDFGERFVKEDGTIPHQLMPDYLHPNANGYRIWAEAMEPVIKQDLGESSELSILDLSPCQPLSGGRDSLDASR